MYAFSVLLRGKKNVILVHNEFTCKWLNLSKRNSRPPLLDIIPVVLLLPFSRSSVRINDTKYIINQFTVTHERKDHVILLCRTAGLGFACIAHRGRCLPCQTTLRITDEVQIRAERPSNGSFMMQKCNFGLNPLLREYRVLTRPTGLQYLSSDRSLC